MQILSIILVLVLLYILLIVFFLTWRILLVGLGLYLVWKIVERFIQ